MGNAVMKYRRERVRRRVQNVGKLRLAASAFREAGASKQQPPPQAQWQGQGQGQRDVHTGEQQQTRFDKIKHKLFAASYGQEDNETKESLLKTSFQKLYREAGSSATPEAKRATRDAEIQKLYVEEGSLSAAPVNLNYEAMLELEYDVSCPLCRMVKNDDLHECRVCGRCFHQTCLENGGFCHDENFAAALKISSKQIGWSCSDCEALGSLLSMEDMDAIMEQFDFYDKNGDSQISWSDFLKVENRKRPPLAPDTIRAKFCEYDTNGDDVVFWQDFVLVEALNVLEKQSQAQLLLHLTPKEIECMKNYFRKKDDYNTGVISVPDAADIYYQWLSRLGLESSGEARLAQERMHDRTNKNKLITWERFIRQRGLSILSARPNTVTISPHIRGHPITGL